MDSVQEANVNVWQDATFWIPATSALIVAMFAIAGLYKTTKDKLIAKENTRLATLKADKATKEAKDANDELARISAQTNDTVMTINSLQHELIEKGKKNEELAEKLQATTNDLLNYETGGGAEPIVSPSINAGNINNVGFDVDNLGDKYPVKGVILTIMDNSWLEGIANMGHEDRSNAFRRSTVKNNIGTLIAHNGVHMAYSINVSPEVNILHFNFYVNWDNGFYAGHCIFTRAEDGMFRVSEFKRDGEH